MTKILLSTALLLSTLAASLVAMGDRVDADAVITGRVFDANTGAPLQGARVEVQGVSPAAISRADGAFRLVIPEASVSGSAVRLTASMSGFVSETAELRLNGLAARVDFFLNPGSDPAPGSRVEIAPVDVDAIADQSVSNLPPPPTAAAAETSSRANTFSAQVGMVAGAPAYPGVPPGWNRESYAHISENEFLAVATNPLSTFSADVDRASYSNIRRFLLDRQLPPVDAVRIEEMVNYFTYDYPEPEGDHPFGVTAEVGIAPWRPEHRLVRVSVASQPIDVSRLPASNLVFLLDVSGSMSSPDKLPLVKQSLRMLVNQLRPRDRVAIVVYAGAAGLVLPSTSGEDRSKILSAIEVLESGGSTAGGEGLRLAYRVARENFIRGGNNRVILATDGDFNVGPSSDSEMIRLVEEMRAQGTFLTVLGFGTGNLQDAKMEQMADHGNGNYAYIDSLIEARKVLVTEMGATLLTVAKDVKFQVEFNPAAVQAYRLIGYENRLLAAEDFNDDTKDAGELGAGHTVTALYEVIPTGVRSPVDVRGVDPLRYQQPDQPIRSGGSDELAFVRIRYKQPTGDRSVLLERPVRISNRPASADLRFASAVAGFGMILRNSEHRGSMTTSDVLSLASGALGRDAEGYRGDFVHLVEVYESLVGGER